MTENKKDNLGELQLVSFTLGKEEFGLDILMVQEINRMLAITKVPKAPNFIEGIINLRGRVIPIVNLRTKLSQSSKEFDKHTRIVVVNSNGKVFGLIVDAVSEVLRLPTSTVEPPPPMVSGVGSEYIKGVGKIGSHLLILLDVDRLFTEEDFRLAEPLAA